MKKNTLVYIGRQQTGEYEGRHYDNTHLVFTDDVGRPFIIKMKTADLRVCKNVAVGGDYYLYFDRFGNVVHIDKV